MRWLSKRLAKSELDDDQVVVLQPGDQLILQSDRKVPRAVFNKIRAQLAEQDDARFIIIESPLRLVAVRHRPEEREA